MNNPFDAFFILSFALIVFLLVGIAIFTGILVADFREIMRFINKYQLI